MEKMRGSERKKWEGVSGRKTDRRGVDGRSTEDWAWQEQADDVKRPGHQAWQERSKPSPKGLQAHGSGPTLVSTEQDGRGSGAEAEG